MLYFSVGVVTVSDAFAGDYSGHEGVQGVITAAEEAGVDPTWSRDLIEAAERQQSILDAIARPAEKTKPWYEYRKIFLTERRIREGVAFWDANASVLETVAERTGCLRRLSLPLLVSRLLRAYQRQLSGD
ncbi:MAG: hypothetical protein CM15mP74_25220 [Halieaceae bacterium]|nr:MAG: hypothetical protein CM15mP74_25220 [Halieaceae bacterium]